jgi:alkyl sulfatase BDS1-like metallo-beta-lactamase superfamily hydrolase
MVLLAFDDTNDFEDADRGFARLDPASWARPTAVVWDNGAYPFLSGDCPDTASRPVAAGAALCQQGSTR